MTDNNSTPAALCSDSRTNEPSIQELRATARTVLRTIFLNVFRHNSACLNSAKYECGWRFTITICWREGEPVPCPAAVERENKSRAAHQVDIEFSVVAAENALRTKIRVDDAGLQDNFPSISLGQNYANELRVHLSQRFGLAYPKIEDEPVG